MSFWDNANRFINKAGEIAVDVGEKMEEKYNKMYSDMVTKIERYKRQYDRL